MSTPHQPTDKTKKAHGKDERGDHPDTGHGHGPSLDSLLANPNALSRADLSVFGYRKYPDHDLPAHPTPVKVELFEKRLQALNKKFLDLEKKINLEFTRIAEEGLVPNPDLVKKRNALPKQKVEEARGIVADLILANHWRELTPEEKLARAQMLSLERSQTAGVESKIAAEAATQKLADTYREFAASTSPAKLIELLRAAGVKDEKIIFKVLAQMKLLRQNTLNPKQLKERGTPKAHTPKFFDLPPQEAEIFDDIINRLQVTGLADELPGRPSAVDGVPPTEIEKVAKGRYLKDQAKFKAFVLKNSADPRGDFAQSLALLKDVLEERKEKKAKKPFRTGLTPQEVAHRNKIDIYLTRNGIDELAELESFLPSDEEKRIYHTNRDIFDLIPSEEDFVNIFSLFIPTEKALAIAQKKEGVSLAEHQAAVSEIQANIKELIHYAETHFEPDIAARFRSALDNLRAKIFNPEDDAALPEVNRVVEETAAKKEILDGPEAKLLVTLVDHFKKRRGSEIKLAAYEGNPEFLHRVSREHIAETMALAREPARSKLDFITPGSVFDNLQSATYLNDIRNCKAIIEFLQEEKIDPLEFAAQLPSAGDLAVGARIKEHAKVLSPDEIKLLLEDFAQWRTVGKNSAGERSLRKTLARLARSTDTKVAAEQIEKLLKILETLDREKTAAAKSTDSGPRSVPALEARGKWYFVGDKIAPFFTDVREVDTTRYSQTNIDVREISGEIEKLTVQPVDVSNLNRIYLRTADGTTAEFVDFRLDSERSPYKQSLYLEKVLSSPDQPAEFVSFLTANALPIFKGLKTPSAEQLNEWFQALSHHARRISPLVADRLKHYPADGQRDFLSSLILTHLSFRLLGNGGELTADKITRLRADERSGLVSGALMFEGITYPVIKDQVVYEFNNHKVLGFDCHDFNTVSGLITLEESGRAVTHRFVNGVLYRMPVETLHYIKPNEPEQTTTPNTHPIDQGAFYDRGDVAQQTYYGAENKAAPDEPTKFELPTPETVIPVDRATVSDDTSLWFDFDGKLRGQLLIDGKQFFANNESVRELAGDESASELEFYKHYHQAVEAILFSTTGSYLPDGLITMEAILTAAPGRPPVNQLAHWQKLAGTESAASWGELVLSRMQNDGLVEEVKSTGWFKFKKGPRTFTVLDKGKDWKTRLAQLEGRYHVRETETYEVLTALEERAILKAYLKPTGANSAANNIDAPNQTYQDFQRFLITSKNAERFKTAEGMYDQLDNIATLFGIDELTRTELNGISEATRLRLWLKILEGLAKEVRLTPTRAASAAEAPRATLPAGEPAPSKPAESALGYRELSRTEEEDIVSDYVNPTTKKELLEYLTKTYQGFGPDTFKPSLVYGFLDFAKDNYKIDSLHPKKLKGISEITRLRLWSEIIKHACTISEVDPNRSSRILNDYINPETASPDNPELKLKYYHALMFKSKLETLCTLKEMELHLENIRTLFGINSLFKKMTEDVDDTERLSLWLSILEGIEGTIEDDQINLEVIKDSSSEYAATAVTQNAMGVASPLDFPGGLAPAVPIVEPSADEFFIKVEEPVVSKTATPGTTTPTEPALPTATYVDLFAEEPPAEPAIPAPAETEKETTPPTPTIDKQARVDALLTELGDDDKVNERGTDNFDAGDINNWVDTPSNEPPPEPPAEPTPASTPSRVDELLSLLGDADDDEEPTPTPPKTPPSGRVAELLSALDEEDGASVDDLEEFVMPINDRLTATAPPEDPPKPPKKPESDGAEAVPELIKSEAFTRTQLRKFLESFDPADPAFGRTDRIANFFIASGINLTQENLDESPFKDLITEQLKENNLTLENLRAILPTSERYAALKPEATKRALEALAKEKQYNDFIGEIKSAGELGQKFLNSKKQLKKYGNKTYRRLLEDTDQTLKDLDPSAITQKKRAKKGQSKILIVQLDKEKPLTHSLLTRRFNDAIATVTEAWREFKKTGGKI